MASFIPQLATSVNVCCWPKCPLAGLGSFLPARSGRRVLTGAAWRQEELGEHFERELAAHESGVHRQSPQHFLATSWQGDALQVTYARSTLQVEIR